LLSWFRVVFTYGFQCLKKNLIFPWKSKMLL
jgi:hypothetical protein